MMLLPTGLAAELLGYEHGFMTKRPGNKLCITGGFAYYNTVLKSSDISNCCLVCCSVVHVMNLFSVYVRTSMLHVMENADRKTLTF